MSKSETAENRGTHRRCRERCGEQGARDDRELKGREKRKGKNREGGQQTQTESENRCHSLQRQGQDRPARVTEGPEHSTHREKARSLTATCESGELEESGLLSARERRE